MPGPYRTLDVHGSFAGMQACRNSAPHIDAHYERIPAQARQNASHKIRLAGEQNVVTVILATNCNVSACGLSFCLDKQSSYSYWSEIILLDRREYFVRCKRILYGFGASRYGWARAMRAGSRENSGGRRCKDCHGQDSKKAQRPYFDLLLIKEVSKKM